MKKILFCASRASHIINFHLPYIEYFKDNGYTVDIIVQGNISDKRIDNCFDTEFTKNPFSPNNIKTILKIKEILLNGKYDIICSNTTLAGVAVRAAVMLIKGRRPYFVHISHGYMFGRDSSIKSHFYRMCEKATSKPIDDLVVMNEEDYYLAKKYKLGKNLHYIYGMGINTEKFPNLTEEEIISVRKSLSADTNNFIMLCVGEFSERKNQTQLIEAFRILSEKHKNIILVFAGNGKMFDKCVNKAKKYELYGKIKFMGQVDDINRLYRSCNLLLSASKMEGLPFNVMEALACGLPAVVSDIKGHRDLIKNNENGFLFEKDDISELVRVIDGLISNKELYKYIKSNTYLQDKYLLENAKPQLLKILDRNFTEKEVAVSVEE